MRSSWYHTHSLMANEMFVLAADVEKYLPPDLVHECYNSTTLRNYPRCLDRIDNYGTGISDKTWSGLDVSLGINGHPSAAKLVRKLMASLPAHAVRCHFKSRNTIINGQVYNRATPRARKTAKKCDDWRVFKGEPISLVVLTYPSSAFNGAGRPARIPQHNRWMVHATMLGAEENARRASSS